MKKILLSIVFLGLITDTVSAQSNPDNPVVVGAKAGTSINNVFGKDIKDFHQDFKPGFQLSGYIELPFTFKKLISMQLELQYSSMGYNGREYPQMTLNQPELAEVKKLDNISLDYLSLPITFKVYPTENFSIDLGGQVGYLVSTRGGGFDLYSASPYAYFLNKNNGRINEELYKDGYRDTDYTKYYEGLDFGVIAGLSYYFDNGLFISTRAYYGLKDIYKHDNNLGLPLPVPQITTEMMQKMEPEQIVQLAKEQANINLANTSFRASALNNVSLQISIGYQF